MKFSLDSKPVKAALFVICLVLLFVMYLQTRTRRQIQEAKQLPFYNTNLEQVEDGTYTAETITSFCRVKLQITVENHIMTDIQVLENIGFKGHHAEPITKTMLEQNKTIVPAIKGEELASLVFISCADKAIRLGTPEGKAEAEKQAQAAAGAFPDEN